MRAFRRYLTTSGALAWIGLFLAVNLAFPLAGGTNADSRFTLLASLAEDGSFRIDPYRDKTSDWARTPDGHYYSNKAPGPSLLALPVYAALDKITTHGAADRAARDELRFRYKARLQKWLAFFFQLLPFSLLLAACGHFLNRSGASPSARNAALFALTFGSTASLFFNSFFGHGLTAAAVLGFALAVLEERPWLAGFSFGLAVLSDYGVAALLPAVLIGFAPYLYRRLPAFLLGAAGPALAWIVYHQKAFGSPFSLATRFQNPEYVDRLQSHPLWGVLAPPSPDLLVKLVAGSERGLLWTQPWVLILLPAALLAAISAAPCRRSLARFSLWGLLGLLLMNASFNGWHGGLAAGPRYLSPIFPAWALLLGLLWDGTSERRRHALSLGLTVSGVLAALVFSGGLAAPIAPLWPNLLHQTFATTATAKIRFALLAVLTAALLLWRNGRKGLGWSPWQKASSESA